MDPKAALRAYLAECEIKPGAFARSIDYDRGNFHKLLNKPEARPSLDLARKIEVATKGRVPMALWAEAA